MSSASTAHQAQAKVIVPAPTNPFGIGAVYRNVTGAVSNVASGITVVTSALNATAVKFETQQWISVAKDAVATCTEFGVTNPDGTPLSMTDAVATMQALVSQLRGY